MFFIDTCFIGRVHSDQLLYDGERAQSMRPFSACVDVYLLFFGARNWREALQRTLTSESLARSGSEQRQRAYFVVQ